MLYKDCLPRFVRFARKVWDVKAEDDEIAARMGIDKTLEFFRSIGMPTSLKALGVIPSENDIVKLALNATMNDTVKLSRIRPIDAGLAAEIYSNAIE